MRETAGGLYSEHPGWGFGDRIALHMPSLYVPFTCVSFPLPIPEPSLLGPECVLHEFHETCTHAPWRS